MRSDSLAHKMWHTVIGIVGIGALVIATFLASSTQRRYVDAFNRLADNVQRLAGPANAQKDSNVDQILAAAASKLMQQDAEIQQLKSSVNAINHPADGLYLGNAMVGKSLGAVEVSDGYITFQLVIADGNGLNFAQIFRYQDKNLKCQMPAMVGQMGSFGVMQTRYPNLRCAIVN